MGRRDAGRRGARARARAAGSRRRPRRRREHPRGGGALPAARARVRALAAGENHLVLALDDGTAWTRRDDDVRRRAKTPKIFVADARPSASPSSPVVPLASSAASPRGRAPRRPHRRFRRLWTFGWGLHGQLGHGARGGRRRAATGPSARGIPRRRRRRRNASHPGRDARRRAARSRKQRRRPARRRRRAPRGGFRRGFPLVTRRARRGDGVGGVGVGVGCFISVSDKDAEKKTKTQTQTRRVLRDAGAGGASAGPPRARSVRAVGVVRFAARGGGHRRRRGVRVGVGARRAARPRGDDRASRSAPTRVRIRGGEATDVACGWCARASRRAR